MLNVCPELGEAMPIHDFGRTALIDVDPMNYFVGYDGLNNDGIRFGVSVWENIGRGKSDSDPWFQVLVWIAWV